MKKLTPMDKNPIEIYDKVTQERAANNQTALELIKSYIINRYTEYDIHKFELSNIGDSAIADKDIKHLLKDICYTRDRDQYFGKIADEIITMHDSHMQSICPHCGLDTPSTLDHYLPKATFPEFSILPINLMPMCHKCNAIKNANWLENKLRTSINIYFDDIFDKKFLFAYIIFNSSSLCLPVVEFQVENREGFSEEVYTIIKNHFKTFDLYDRYLTHINSELDITRKIISKSKNEIPFQLQKINLCSKRDSLIETLGVNNWRTCLYDAMYNSDEFINFCLS